MTIILPDNSGQELAKQASTPQSQIFSNIWFGFFGGQNIPKNLQHKCKFCFRHIAMNAKIRIWSLSLLPDLNLNPDIGLLTPPITLKKLHEWWLPCWQYLIYWHESLHNFSVNFSFVSNYFCIYSGCSHRSQHQLDCQNNWISLLWILLQESERSKIWACWHCPRCYHVFSCRGCHNQCWLIHIIPHTIQKRQ